MDDCNFDSRMYGDLVVVRGERGGWGGPHVGGHGAAHVHAAGVAVAVAAGPVPHPYQRVIRTRLIFLS